MAQLSGYPDQPGLAEGRMIVVDQRKGRTWEPRLWREEVERDGQTLHLVGA